MTTGTRRLRNLTCWAAFLPLLVIYWLTTPGTVSYWDCPEYVSAAWLLEIGHPPGNPLWMLVERIITMLAPSGAWAAYAVNLSSGLFTALAGFYLARVIFTCTLWILYRKPMPGVSREWMAAGAALTGALIFGWCDSAWFSAVEAEVYAMSIFFTALSVWIMVKWAFTPDPRAGNRLLILLAYIFGLSLGVHQLNLLCIPALALIWGLKRGIRHPGKIIVIIILGMAAVGAILVCMMPSAIALAADIELFCVNTLGLPMLSGVAAYILLLAGSLLLALCVTARSRNRGVVAAAIFPAIFFSGIFTVGGHFLPSAAISAIISLLLVRPGHFDGRRLNLAFWMLAMILTGYSVYAIIPIRGHIPSPANPTMPGEPFAFAMYQAREQYGGAPLLYGPTPYSRPMLTEEWSSDRKTPVYRKYALVKGKPQIAPLEPGAKTVMTPGSLAPEDSAYNRALINSGKGGYIIRGYSTRNIFTPELNCWLPRISSRDPRDLQSFHDWAGMDTSTMTRVAISEAIDTLGRPVSRMDAEGNRVSAYSYRPTLLQNVRMLLTYQIGYMYMRYLMWNFCGRQNDIASQGEIQHGNFITGVDAVDNLMLGAEDSLPSEAGKGNKGRNRYYGLPLLLGIIGILWLMRGGRRGRAVDAITALLFFMTGIAIVIYLNQSPGEPRERDYSFLGSFWAFAIWTAYGALAVARLFKTPWAYLLTLMVPVWMCVENYDDHDRRGRHAASALARTTLEALEPNAVLIVDGDNFTFPLWYAQEVEGVRRDVRIVNMAYMSLPRYAANMMSPWRESEAVPTTLRRQDIIYDALKRVTIAQGARDTLPADVIMERLRRDSLPVIDAAYARLVIPGDTIVFNLRKLSRSGTDRNVDFGQLMLFDMISTAAHDATPRPFYWMRVAYPNQKLHLPDTLFTPWLLGSRLGKLPENQARVLSHKGVDAVTIPNDPDREVYMDATPAKMVGNIRTALILAARRMLADGDLRGAEEALGKADVPLGDTPYSYAYVADGDSVADMRRELGRLQIELADKILATKPLTPYAKARAFELKARGRHNMAAAWRRKEAWRKYRTALPPHLRPMMAPI